MRTTPCQTKKRTTTPGLRLLTAFVASAVVLSVLWLPHPAAAGGKPGGSLEQARKERQARAEAEQQEQIDHQARKALKDKVQQLEWRLRTTYPHLSLPEPLLDPHLPAFTAPDPAQGRVAAERAARQHAEQRAQIERQARVDLEQRLKYLQGLEATAAAHARTQQPPARQNPPQQPALSQNQNQNTKPSGAQTRKQPFAPPPPPPEKGVAKTRADYTNPMGMEFMRVRRGTFQMGCGSENEGCKTGEYPRHKVTLTKDFYLGRHEVTQRQWQAVMNSNPSRFKHPDNPVESVSWDEVQTFIRKLNERAGRACYRLPTEAEWEYAARGGNKKTAYTAYSFGNDPERLGEYAWFRDNSGKTEDNEAGGRSHLVGRKKPNALGLYDMHGNVWEWVQDWVSAEYGAEPATDPRGPETGNIHVLRGCSWDNTATNCRTAYRNLWGTGERHDLVGFRLVLTSVPQKKTKRR